ncbi:hypothetical protein [Fructilactobacillus florum]|uniref:hypothetical protein n=1 Tax=Fructilactobacillus florum TaxID=640331 RepID=UPI0006D1E4ED|nr:hypothetical protein [Fructilactobacillus florum]
MKAVIQNNFNGVDGLSIENIASPKLTMTSDLIQVKYAPILPWDLKMEHGALNQFNSTLPRIIGYSFSGTIKDTGILRNKKISR